MTTNQMRDFLKARYPKSTKWKERVNKMPEEQVIAIFTNPYIGIPKDLGLKQAHENINAYYRFKPPDPEYTICPHCGAHLDRDEHCDCYEEVWISHENPGI